MPKKRVVVYIRLSTDDKQNGIHQNVIRQKCEVEGKGLFSIYDCTNDVGGISNEEGKCKL
jgi:hypothetical protein